MDDKDIAALIRMAAEAERLEEAAPLRFEWARPNHSDRAQQVRKLAAGIATLAAAACVGFMALVWLKPTPTPVTPPLAVIDPKPAEVVALVERDPEPVASPKAEFGSVIMAFFRDSDDRCSCVQLNAADFKGGLAEVHGQELLRRALANACHDNPERVMVIAMQGPTDALPSSTAEAELIAAAMREESAHCGGDAMCISSVASPFFSEGVTLVTSTLGYQ